MAAMARKRPCSICRRWFQPDVRVGARQHVCSAPECQKKRRQRKQAQWRRQNPDYFVGRRWAGAEDKEEPARAPPPLEQIPWDVVQSQIGSKATVILGLLAKVLLQHVQSQIRAQGRVTTAESQRLPPRRAQSQMEVLARDIQAGLDDDRADGKPG